MYRSIWSYRTYRTRIEMGDDKVQFILLHLSHIIFSYF
jgi:hypothetical protein